MKSIRKFFIGLVGGTVLLIGALMIVLPGPALIVIPIGLGILATEFLWARKWLEKGKSKFEEWKQNRAEKKSKQLQEGGKN